MVRVELIVFFFMYILDAPKWKKFYINLNCKQIQFKQIFYLEIKLNPK